MAQTEKVYSGDVIEHVLAAPMDWGKLEALVYDVLLADDFPTLRRIGGVGDAGMDAVEETFYDAERKVTTVVQVTSAQAQRAKVKDTLKKLKKNGITPKTLIFVTRHPVTAEKRVEMNKAADEESVTLEVRDQTYLVSQLGKNSKVFARHFADIGTQLSALLDTPDPLHTASSRLQHSLLATLGAFVLNEHSRIARGTLFEKSVVAALAAAPNGKATRSAILADVRALLPEEGVSEDQVKSAIERLIKNGDCTANAEDVICSDAVKAQCLAAAQRANDGHKQLVKHILAACKKAGPLSDAAQGYLERNIRRSIVHLLRASGPLKSIDDLGLKFDEGATEEVHHVLGQDLAPEIARAAIVSFSGFVTNPTHANTLAPLAKSYAALAIRNVDPIGRRWQEMALSRSMVALDTDALLFLIIEELPEHNGIITALRALKAKGVELIVPEHVFHEAVGHIERAPRTFKRFEGILLRLPPELVNARVWHAVVRGYYFAHRAGFTGSFATFYNKYFQPEDPESLVEHILSRRIPMKRLPMDEVPEKDEDALNDIGLTILQYRESFRKKALFRDRADMAQRVREDVAMALILAARADEQIGANAKGYIASSDFAFRAIERDDRWRPRKKVHLWTSGLPQLSFFAFGSTLPPNDAVDFLFSPITIAAADLMGEQITMLTTIGVDLKDVPLERLDWDLQQKIGKELDALQNAAVEAKSDTDAATIKAATAVARVASDAGYALTPQMAAVINDFEETQDELESERQRRQQLEDQLRSMVTEVREHWTAKSKRRFNTLAKELGVFIADDAEDGDEFNKEASAKS
jgi:hypothetical protein